MCHILDFNFVSLTKSVLFQSLYVLVVGHLCQFSHAQDLLHWYTSEATQSTCCGVIYNILGINDRIICKIEPVVPVCMCDKSVFKAPNVFVVYLYTLFHLFQLF